MLTIKIRYIIIVLFTVVFGTGYYIWSQWKSYHSFDGRCISCHLTNPDENGEKLLFTKDLSLLCLNCHKDAVRVSHPVDMKPTMEIPKDFLLDRKGNITCNTCHTTHKAGYGKYHIRVASIGEPFCRNCHLMLEDGAALHQGSIGSAHMGRSVASRYISGNFGVALDDLSLRCLMCHDGSLGNEALVTQLKSGEYEHGSDIGLSHPIGIPYSRTPAYKSIQKLSPEIRLFNGRIGCGTCHNPYGKRHFELVMSNEYSALCFACHNK